MGLSIATLEILLLISAVVAILARKVRLPYTIGLVLAGIGIAYFQVTPGLHMTKELIFSLFLPPLIFEAAFAIRWDALKKDLLPLGVMASVGVILSTIVVFLGMNLGLGWDWRAALMFGVLISATDPVSVIAMLKDATIHGRLRLLVEGESILNDGTAAALFAVALAAVTGSQPTVIEALGSFVVTAGGGILVGGIVGYLSLLLMGRTTDHLVEILVSTVAAFGSFLLAEQFHLSGVLATLVTGLVLGNFGPMGALTSRGREAAETFWEYAAFVANSLVFLLMGDELAERNYSPFLLAASVAVGLVILGRAVSVYATANLFAWSPVKIAALHQHIMFWGGLRGALGLALALGLPDDMPMRNEIITVTFAVVAFSVIVQGLTVKPLLVRIPPEAEG